MTGRTTAWVRHEGSWHASGDRVLNDLDPDTPGGGGAGTGPIVAGAVIPIHYDLASLPATKWYVSPTGSDSAAGTVGAPFATLDKAVAAVTGSGQAIVLRDGVYPMTGTTITVPVSKRGLLITAYPGETPTFDGSKKAPTTVTTEGALVKFAYRQMPARANGDGIGLTNGAYPDATFASTTTGAAPTGLAAERGFAVVTSDTDYTIPATQTRPASGNLKVIVGMYPDQVWVNNVLLRQVCHKSLVKPGFFWVDRDNSNDNNPSRTTTLYMHSTDATDMNVVRVSDVGGDSPSTGNFLLIDADNVTIRGVRIVRHSPSLAFFAIQANSNSDGLKLEDVFFEDHSSICMKLYGGDGSNMDGSEIISNAILNRVTVDTAGWQGLSALYTNDLRISHCKFERTNPWGEFDAAPKSGAIKIGKSHRAVVEYNHFTDMGGHCIWMDQSNYDCTVASNYMVNSTGSIMFWEISHRLLLINNVIVRSSDSGITLRVSGGSGVWAINNTIVGGASTYYCILDNRGHPYTGTRPLAEHSERYGTGGSYGSDAPTHPSSDLDKARPGAFHATLPNATPGMNWYARSEAVVNNVIAHYATGTGTEIMSMYFRPNATLPGGGTITIPTTSIIPLTDDLFDGNIYQVTGTRMAQINSPTGTTVMPNLSGWRGTTGLRSTGLYGSGGTPEAHGREGKGPHGLGWVTRTGAPTADLDAVQGTAADVVAGTDTAMLARIKSYIDPGLRRYGSNIAPPGGW